MAIPQVLISLVKQKRSSAPGIGANFSRFVWICDCSNSYYGDRMTAFQVIILSLLFIGAVATLFYKIGLLKAELRQTRERLEKLEAAQDKPIGYNQMAAFDELTAYLIGIEKRCQIAREFSNAAKRGNFNGQKKD